VAKKPGEFNRGDIVWLDFTPTKGHEQAGRRPAIVLSPLEYNARAGLMLVCPITSKTKGYPFEIKVEGKIRGAILVDQIRSVDWRERNAQLIESNPAAVIEAKRLLDLLLP
jgi:mRNA interferase MazF